MESPSSLIESLTLKEVEPYCFQYTLFYLKKSEYYERILSSGDPDRLVCRIASNIGDRVINSETFLDSLIETNTNSELWGCGMKVFFYFKSQKGLFELLRHTKDQQHGPTLL